MSDAAIRAQVVAVLEGVTGIGPVHDYLRLKRSSASLLDLLRDETGMVCGWMVEPESIEEKAVTMGIRGQNEQSRMFRITSFYEHDDNKASSKALWGLIDAIFDAFRKNPTLNGVAENSETVGAIVADPQPLENEDGADLYHEAEIRLIVHERVSRGG